MTRVVASNRALRVLSSLHVSTPRAASPHLHLDLHPWPSVDVNRHLHRHLYRSSPYKPSCQPYTSFASIFTSSISLTSKAGEKEEHAFCSRHDYLIPSVSVTFKCSGEMAEDVVEALMNFGASSVSIEEWDVCKLDKGANVGPVAWEKEKRRFWNKCKLTALFSPGQDVEASLTLAFNSVGLDGKIPYEQREVEHEKWEQQVKDSFQPLRITEKLWIVPKWCSPPEATATNIILDPGLAFGTGDHPTTRLCLQWLSIVVKGGESILDYGIGSGILAISALKLGASRAVGIDIDPVAVSSATQNASLNDIGPDKLQVLLAGNDELPLVPGQFDIAVANLLLNPLLELSAHLLSYVRPGGILGLSGILESQVEEVQCKYGSYLENIQVIKHDGWACLHATKKESVN